MSTNLYIASSIRIIMELTYKKPSVLLSSMVANFTQTFQSYMKNSAQLLEEIKQQAEKEGLPNEQLRKLLETALKQRGLSQRSVLRILPPELKNQNMIRKRPKKDPLVKEWKIDMDLIKFKQAVNELVDEGYKKGYIVHDNKRVVDVYGKGNE